VASVLLALAQVAAAQSNDAVRELAQQETQPLLNTLQALVEIESGTADVEGVTRIGALIAERLRTFGGSVELVPPAADRPRSTSLPQEFADTVVARFGAPLEFCSRPTWTPSTSAACSRSNRFGPG
jgi:glutamate carboxypeptidase